jgi:hypothetical protein
MSVFCGKEFADLKEALDSCIRNFARYYHYRHLCFEHNVDSACYSYEYFDKLYSNSLDDYISKLRALLTCLRGLM